MPVCFVSLSMGEAFHIFSFISDSERYIMHVKIEMSHLTRAFRKSVFTTLIQFASPIIRNTGVFSQLWLSSILLYLHIPV